MAPFHVMGGSLYFVCAYSQACQYIDAVGYQTTGTEADNLYPLGDACILACRKAPTDRDVYI